MEWVEAEAKSNEEAKARIMEALNVTDSATVEFEEMKVTRRFLGMGGKSVKIRGRLKEEPRTQKSASAPAKPIVSEPVVTVQQPEPIKSADLKSEEEPESEEKEIRPPAVHPPAAPTGLTTFASPYRPWASEGPSAIVIPPEGKGYGRKLFSTEPAAADETAELDDASSTSREKEDLDFVPPTYTDHADSPATSEDREKAVEFINGLVTKMGMKANVSGWLLEDRLLMVMDSEDSALLIGRKGDTLESIQYLTDIFINRKREERVRIIVDSKYYREKRRYKVFQIAKEAADNAGRTGKPVRLNPMSPAERQIVHSTLAEDKRVETISEGQGNRRKVVVYPKGRRQGKPSSKRDSDRGGYDRGGSDRGSYDKGGSDRGGYDKGDRSGPKSSYSRNRGY
ncbi:MAG: KH domain-containing protein [Nitrospinota bacterium]|nr:KH domain-containing protein [Nitrospinota bacterium]